VLAYTRIDPGAQAAPAAAPGADEEDGESQHASVVAAGNAIIGSPLNHLVAVELEKAQVGWLLEWRHFHVRLLVD
jgi:hypothetical protein